MSDLVVIGRSSEKSGLDDSYIFEASVDELADDIDGSELLTTVLAKAAYQQLQIQKGRAEAKPVVVLLHEGVYRISETVTFGRNLSGTAEAPTIIRSYPGETAILDGGVVLDDFESVSGEMKSRLSQEARRNVVVADLPRALVPDLGSLNPAFGRRPEVYHNGVLTGPARYPNDGWLEIKDVPQNGEKMIHPGLDRDTSAVPRGRHYGRFVYPGNRPASWEDRDDIWIHGYWTWDWSDEFLEVESIDKDEHEVTPKAPHHRYGYTKGQRFYFLNVFEELDAPGEWYIDTKERKLYYWPLEKIKSGSVVLSVLSDPVLSISGVEHLTIESLELRGGRGSGITVSAGAHVSILGCEFSNFGGTGVSISGGESHVVSGCDIHDIGAGGVSATGGDRRTLEPGNIRIENNHIFRFAQRIRTYKPAIHVGGVGNIVSHNLIHHAPHMGMNVDGNDHSIEYNEIYGIAEETGDVGAIYMGRDWTERGVAFRYNFIHDIEGPGSVGAMGIYLDDAASGVEIFRNLFYKAKRAAFIGGGRDTRIIENVFVDCEPSVHVDARGKGWASAYIAEGGSWHMYRKLEAMNYQSEPYASRYPALATILDGDPAIPAGNEISGNVSSGGTWSNFDKRIPGGTLQISDNVVNEIDGVDEFLKALAARKAGEPIPEPPEGLPDIEYSRIGLIENEYRSF